MYSSKFANLYSQGWSLTLRVSSLRECRFDLSTLPPAARHTSPPRNKFNLHVLRLACALPLPFPRQQIKFAHYYYYCTAISIMWETIFAGSDMLDRHCEKIQSDGGHYAVDASELVLPQVEVNETLPGDVEPSLHFCQLPFLTVLRTPAPSPVRYSACHLICA